MTKQLAFGAIRIRTQFCPFLKTTLFPSCLATPRKTFCCCFARKRVSQWECFSELILGKTSHSKHPETTFLSNFSWIRLKQTIPFHSKSHRALPLEREVEAQACLPQRMMFTRRCEQQRAQRFCQQNRKVQCRASLTKAPRKGRRHVVGVSMVKVS